MQRFSLGRFISAHQNWEVPETYFSALCRKQKEEMMLATEGAGVGSRRGSDSCLSTTEPQAQHQGRQ